MATAGRIAVAVVARLGLTWLLLLLLAWTPCRGTETWQKLPALETFSTYEDMQRYFDQRNFRSMRHIDNPTDDSYLDAFNHYNSQLEASGQLSHSRQKREQQELPSKPRMLRFELSDAVEPSEEVKQLLRQHASREIKAQPAATTAAKTTTTTQPTIRRTTAMGKRKPRRQRREAAKVLRQPANFKVQMIPFEATDAREPDAETAQLIKRARALDLPSHGQGESQRVQPSEHSQRPFKLRIRKTKRIKRSAPPSMPNAPEFFKFELADAKAPPTTLMMQRSGKEMKPTLLTMETQTLNRTLPTMSAQTSTSPSTSAQRLDDNLVVDGEATAETKRMYIYKEAPQTHMKTKKSISTLPHEVQKVITQLIKDGHGGKAYIKYMPAQKADYEHFKSKPLSYNLKPSAFVKYVPAKLPEPVHPVQVHIQPVPVVEQLRYVYKPSYAKLYSASPTIAQPIVVQDTPATKLAAVEEVHHTYSAQLSAPQPPAPPPPTTADIAAPQFRASKPDPLQEHVEPTVSYLQVHSSHGSAHIKPLEHYQYEIHPEPQPSSAPQIKIEYHAPPDHIKEHYKELPEFRELSTLIGKSPDDQIHGLTYLLAKEMQAKLQRQGKLLDSDRPQDSTSPILFHPGPVQPQLPTPSLKALVEHGSLGVQPGRLIGMGKTKQYVPIIEPGNNDIKQVLPAPTAPAPAPAAETKLATPTSFIKFAPGHGLSHGYEGISDEQPLTTLEHVVQHPAVAQHGLLGSALPAELENEKTANGLHFANSDQHKTLHQYASKYAFGYRIRDFHTGNDFGHKQNRDLHGVTRGQYHILLPDGRIQNVIYHADDTGFHADVSFESGTARH
ncbi:uncharacterized protein LOC115634575 [Scaptodrosophila lebanonensis]|uniref:Uncharacterized protein LOC115634575 n=1 Tax=Drosophila lebanonensis TaxID=7225 RepID=A0A6J2UIP6_DROLE|nr:uncharacterized protein LOC115634575 [Scaptodrosophila lebanonensis]